MTCIGQTTNWIQRDLFGDVIDVVPATVTTEPQTVDRVTGESRECVGINAGGKFRFVPVENLQDGKYSPAKVATAKGRTRPGKPRQRTGSGDRGGSQNRPTDSRGESPDRDQRPAHDLPTDDASPATGSERTLFG